MNKSFLSSLLFLVLFCSFSKAQNTDSIIVLNDETEILNIGKQVYYLEDKEGKLTIEDIQKPEYQKQFKKSEQEILNFGITKSNIWIKCMIQRKDKMNNTFYLNIEESNIWYIDFFKDSVLINQTGSLRPYKSRMMENFNSFVFPLEQISKNLTYTYYIKLESQHPLKIPITINKLNNLIKETHYKDIFFACFFGFLIIMIAYHILIFIITKDLGYIYYVLSFANLLFSYTFLHNNYLFEIFNNTWLNKYWLSINNIAFLWFFLYIDEVLQLRIKYKLYHNIVKYNAILQLILIIPLFLLDTYLVSIIIYALANIFHISIVVILWILSYQKNKNAQIVAIGYTALLTSIVIFILNSLNIIEANFFTNNAMLFGTTIELLFSSLALSNRINTMRKEKETALIDKQASQLALLQKSQENEKLVKEQNIILEEKVHERTEELQVLNEELNATVEELGLTLETLDTQKKIVESTNRKITASINYAQTIQQAVLPDKLILESYLQDYFLLYRPKDIVSGDFYWVAPIRRGYVVAVADCTGHGVAGSFMSLVGINLLGKMEDELETLSPAEMIRKLNIGVDKALKQDERQSYNEGMDIGIVRVEKEGNNYTLTFAGAKRPLYYISKEERKLQEIAGDRYSVGIGTQREMFIQNHTLTLKTGDSFYLLSDGLADQNNEKRKRLGENILKETLQNLFDQESNTQLQQLEKLLDEHQGTAEQRDDITLLGVKLI